MDLSRSRILLRGPYRSLLCKLQERPSGAFALITKGKQVLSASANGEVAIWSLATRSKRTLPRHPNAVSSASFGPDDKLIVTTSRDQIVRLWDSVKLTQVLTLKGHEGPVLSSGFSPDGKRLVTSSDDKTARMWSLGPDTIPFSLEASDYSILSAALNANGMDFVTGGFDGKISLYKVEKEHGISKERELTPNIGAITGIGFSADLSKLIAGSSSGRVFLWDRTGNSPVQLVQLAKGDTLVAINSAGNLAAASESLSNAGDHTRIWDLQTRRSWPLEGASSIKSMEFDGNGTQVVAGSEAAIGTGERLALVWDARTGRRLSSFEHDGPVLSAHFSRDGQRIATSSLGGYKAYVWAAKKGEHKRNEYIQVFVGHSYDVNSARFSPDAERIVTASSDRTVRVWDVRTGTEILQFRIGTEAVDAFFTQDGRRVLVTTAQGEVRDYDVTWSVVLDRDLKSRVCRAKLPGIDKANLCSR
jgi:WD40 repeat protein